MKFSSRGIAIFGSVVAVVSIYFFIQRKRVVPTSFVEGVLSPDSKRVASTIVEDKQGGTRVVIYDTKGRILSDEHKAAILSDPAWSADSNILFFAKDSGQTSGNIQGFTIVSTQPGANAGLDVVVAKDGVTLDSPSASADGEHLAYFTIDTKNPVAPLESVYIYDLKTHQEVGLPPYRMLWLSKPTWSQDGKVIAFDGSSDTTQEDRSPYIKDGKNPSVNTGMVWATAKDNFVPHFFKAKFSAFEPNGHGEQFALVSGEDKRGNKHLLQVVNTAGNQVASLKRASISVNIAWNSTDTAIFFLDNFYSKKQLQLCRWDVKTGRVDVLQPLNDLRGRILGYRNGTLFYTTARQSEDERSQINQITTD